jgi:RNA polymerase sigma factor (sigma-70 family)
MASMKMKGEACAHEALVGRARGGDREAMDELVRAIQDPIYGLAMRMLAEPTAAEDATQEILIKVLTRLDSFRGDSRFLTWVHAVAANHLRNMCSRGKWRHWTSLDDLSELPAELHQGRSVEATEQTVMTREIRLHYLQGVLTCLDRDQRLALVLGEVLELTGSEAAKVLGISPATFRKRLSRARQRMRAFMLSPRELVRTGCQLPALPAYRTSDHLVNDLAQMMDEHRLDAVAA